jgi:uncharacterized membrane-anchored protein YitT (DUF2179 family)
LNKASEHLKNSFFIIVGTGIYAFGLVYLNMANHLAEGGVTGITLILKALFHIDPAFSTLALNAPLILIGGKMLGRRSLMYTVLGTLSLSFFLFVWQRVPVAINLDHDLLIVALLAGFFAGIGSGLVYRFGGTTGGADIIARIIEKYRGISMGKTLLALDILVLVLSLSYIDLVKMMYTLIVSYVFSRVVDSITSGGYAAKGLLIVTNKSDQIASRLMIDLERGVTFLNGEGAFSKEEKKIIYMVVSAHEITEAKRVINDIDANAFISIINVHEVEGEGFTYLRPKKTWHEKRK